MSPQGTNSRLCLLTPCTGIQAGLKGQHIPGVRRRKQVAAISPLVLSPEGPRAGPEGERGSGMGAQVEKVVNQKAWARSTRSQPPGITPEASQVAAEYGSRRREPNPVWGQGVPREAAEQLRMGYDKQGKA